MALVTLFEGPYAFSLLFKQMRASSWADGTGSGMAAVERPINGKRAAAPNVTPLPNERRNPLRDAIIVCLHRSGPERIYSTAMRTTRKQVVAIPFIAWSESQFRRRSHIRLQRCR